MTSQILFIYPDSYGNLQAAKTKITNEFPENQIIHFPVSRNSQIWILLKSLRESVSQGFYKKVIIFSIREFFNINFFLVFFLCLFGFIKDSIFIQKDHLFLSQWEVVKNTIFLLLSPFIIIIKLPYYIYRQIICNFILTKEDTHDEFVGFGKGRYLGGVFYWLIFNYKIKKFGLFGIDCGNYWGMPLGIHSWPVSVYLLKKFGFRKLNYLAFLLLSFGIIWLCFTSNQAWIIILIPLLLFSNYIIYNIFTGTWELLAWGWGMLAFAAIKTQMPELAGVFVVLSLLSHPGVCSIICIIIGAFVMLTFGPTTAFEFVLRIGVTSFILSIWWIIPYFRNLKFLGRTRNQNNNWQNGKPWSVVAAYQLVLYSLFAIFSTFPDEVPGFSIILLFPPLIIYYVIKINWIFSRYTTMNLFFIIGLIYLINYPSLPEWILFIYIIYSSPKLIWGIMVDPFSGFDLTPIKAGELKKKILDAFTLVDGRVGFEMELSMERGTWKYSPAIGYFLADTNHDLVNVAYSQIGDSRIIEKYTQFFNNQSTFQVFKEACENCGVEYMVAYSEEFEEYLLGLGAEKLSEISEAYLSDAEDNLPVRIVVFRLPWKIHRISPSVELSIGKNCLSFYANGGKVYNLKYSAFPGWRAFQNGKRLPIRDANPGIEVQAKEDGLLELKYSLSYYWSP